MNEIEDGRERGLSADLETSKAELAARLKGANWSYDISDDAGARLRGGAEIAKVYAAVDALAKRDRPSAIEVWDANAPKDQERPHSLLAEIERRPRSSKPRSGPGSTRFVNSLDREMAKAHLAEGGWRDRQDLSKIMTDLEALARVDPAKAIALWDKHRPDDPDKPLIIDNDDKAPKQKPGAQVSEPSAPQTQKSKEASPSDPDDPVLVALRKRYLVADDKYYKRDPSRTLAFEDLGRRLATKHDDAEIAKSMVELAQIKGWETIKVKGSEAFRREVWLQAQLKGLEVHGFRPQSVDLARITELQAGRGQPSIGSVNTIEKSERVREPKDGASPSRSEEPNPKLNDNQQITLDALKAIMRARGDSEKAIEMAESVTLDRFQAQRVHVGKLLEQGRAPFENNPNNEATAFVKLQTQKGIEVIWGVDLPRALDEAKATGGDQITLVSRGKQPVTLTVKDKNDESEVVGERPITVHRNVWEAHRLETLREEVRQKLTELSERPGTSIRTFDAEAPRAQPRRESTRAQAKIEKDRSRG